MKFFYILTFGFLFNLAQGQNFYFEPVDTLNKIISINNLSDLTIDIIRSNTIDTLYLEYELITNTLPEEWYQGYCDNHGCWSYLPLEGEMSACYDDLNSFITLSIDPNGIDGFGQVAYYIYETDHYDDGLIMTFIAQTPGVVGINEMSANTVSFFPNPAQDILYVKSVSEIEKIYIYSISGKLLHEDRYYNSLINIDISFLSKGAYLLKTQLKNGLSSSQLLKVI
jgi:hypothetical protein